MFAFLKKQSPESAAIASSGKAVIAGFGKLPIRADFIKHNVSEREIRALDEWIQEGYSLISRRLNGAQAAEQFPSNGIHHAVFTGVDSQRSVLATIGPGCDRSGRWYPFVIAALAQAPFIKQVQAAIPLAYAPFYRHAEQILGQRWRHEPLETLLGCLDSVAADCIKGGRGATVDMELGVLRDTPVSCMHELAASYGGNPSAFYQASCDLLGAVIRRGASRTSWGVRLPLPAGEHSEAGLIFWLRLVDSMLGQNWHGNYFWQLGDQQPGHVTIFFRRVPASYLPHLFDQSLSDGNVQRIEPLLADPVSPSRKARDLAALEHGSLLDLLSLYLSGGNP